MHEVQSDPFEGGVLECLGHGADDEKTVLLPEFHCRIVRFNDRVEFHRGVSLLARPKRRGARPMCV